MTSVPRLGLALIAAVLVGVPAGPAAAPPQTRPAPARESLPDFDIRDERPAAPELAAAGTEQDRQPATRTARKRLNRESGSMRVLERPGLSVPRGSTNAAIRAFLVANAGRLGLERRDLSSLTAVRDYRSASLGVRHVLFRQDVDGIPVFDSAIGVHLLPEGTILRVTSNAAPTGGRPTKPEIDAARARDEAALHAGVTPGAAAAPALAWLPVDGSLRLAWHVVVTGAQDPDLFDVLIDARTAELLVRRNRVRYSQGFGRVVQGPATASVEPRRPDPTPQGADACPPPVNYAVRSLDGPFRDAATVLSGTGRLEGNNTRIVRGFNLPAAEGTFDGAAWMFDFPFNSDGSAETFLFFAMNFAHDFYYDLGFDEAAGNFQVDNFGRGGVAGDPVRAKARAPGRNNANYVHASDGNSPTINMFLWDGLGCWADDVDDDGFTDLDGDYDLDIVIHEYHHGVHLRLNTAWFGSEAGAMGEGGGDFFAYSVNGDTVLAEYSRPGGIRRVNSKGYGDWTCNGSLCPVHTNGEIWANALWDVRERFRGDLVRGNEAAAIHESHQIYVDGLKISPPRPTMLDMRDAMLEADAIRNPGGPVSHISQNYCRLWESFAGRGMGVTAMDTAEAGASRVSPAYDVPEGCVQPPLPPLMTAVATVPTGHEAGTVPAVVTFRRSVPAESAIAVNYTVSGTAVSGSDYVALPGVATMPAGAVEVTVPIEPIDDGSVEGNETVTVSLASGSAYAITAPSFATVTIVSDDVAPDFIMTGLSAPGPAGAGTTIQVTDTTRNQGTGPAGASETWFYLSANLQLDASDTFLGKRSVGPLAAGAVNTGTAPFVLPSPLSAGTYYLFAKADGGASVPETNESNNTRVVTLGVGPDLLMMAVTAPWQAGPGVSIAVSDTTTNQGGGSAGASATRFFLSRNLVLDAGDPLLGSRAVGELAPGAASQGSTTVTIPADTATGNYYIFAQADGGSAVAESNESNNTRVAFIQVGPDLTVTALTLPQRAASGGTIAITDTTRNIGAGPAGASATAFYVSSNLTLDASDTRLAPVRTVNPLAAGESSIATTTVTLPELTVGSWFILASADDGKAVTETQEANNVRFGSVLVGPDLTFLAVGAPSSASAGSTIALTDTVRNLGVGTAGASVVRFYLSTNIVLDGSDVPLDGSRSVPALAGTASSSGTTTVVLPAGKTGNLYILFVADSDNAVPEASETNNTGARFIQIAQ